MLGILTNSNWQCSDNDGTDKQQWIEPSFLKRGCHMGLSINQCIEGTVTIPSLIGDSPWRRNSSIWSSSHPFLICGTFLFFWLAIYRFVLRRSSWSFLSPHQDIVESLRHEVWSSTEYPQQTRRWIGLHPHRSLTQMPPESGFFGLCNVFERAIVHSYVLTCVKQYVKLRGGNYVCLGYIPWPFYIWFIYIFWDITLASSSLPYLYVCLSSYMGGMRPRFTGRWPAWIASDWSMGAESRIKKPVFCVCLPGKHTKNYGKSPCFMGISTISLAMSFAMLVSRGYMSWYGLI